MDTLCKICGGPHATGACTERKGEAEGSVEKTKVQEEVYKIVAEKGEELWGDKFKESSDHKLHWKADFNPLGGRSDYPEMQVLLEQMGMYIGHFSNGAISFEG